MKAVRPVIASNGGPLSPNEDHTARQELKRKERRIGQGGIYYIYNDYY